MVNHCRTLLLNVSGSLSPAITFPAEEYVPPDFISATMPSHLQAIRNVLFGTNPDRLMYNYRLRQYMTCLHSTPLKEYVYALDPRVTYWPIADQMLFNGMSTTIAQYAGDNPRDLTIVNPSNGLITSDRLYYSWQVTVVDSSTVSVQQLHSPASTTTSTYTTTNNLSSLFSLGTSNLNAFFQTGVGSAWTITILARPSNLSDVVVALNSATSSKAISDLFKNVTLEPTLTFRNLWYSNEQLPYKLGGLLMGLAYATNALR